MKTNIPPKNKGLDISVWSESVLLAMVLKGLINNSHRIRAMVVPAKTNITDSKIN